ncbi:MAG: hypothetical protein J5865_00550 [Lachnospiraceae bacterium]|nr:hypothetical protein [Lachnospiraceae bacterium]
MKKANILALALTAVTLAACVLMAASQIALLQQSQSWFARSSPALSRFVQSGLIPVVCMLLLALAMLQKISVGMCSLLTLVIFVIYGICTVAPSGFPGLLDPAAWFVNSQGLIMSVCPVWFTAMLVYGAMEKRPVIWIVSGVGLLLLIFLQAVVPSVLADTKASGILLHAITGGSLALIAALGIHDRLNAHKNRPPDETAAGLECML